MWVGGNLLLHYGGCCFPEQAMFCVWSGPTPAGAGTWKCGGRKAWVCGFLPWGACACGGACARGCSPPNGCAVWKCHQREGSVLSPGLRRRKRRTPVFSGGCTSGGSAEKACPPPTEKDQEEWRKRCQAKSWLAPGLWCACCGHLRWRMKNAFALHRALLTVLYGYQLPGMLWAPWRPAMLSPATDRPEWHQQCQALLLCPLLWLFRPHASPLCSTGSAHLGMSLSYSYILHMGKSQTLNTFGNHMDDRRWNSAKMIMCIWKWGILRGSFNDSY